MISMWSIRIKTIIGIPIIVILFLLLSIIEDVSPLFAVVMIMWVCLLTYSLLYVKEMPLLFCFMVTFFVFLLGRQFCYHYLHIDQVYKYLDVTNNYTYLCLIISLFGIIIGLLLSSAIKIRSNPQLVIVAENANNIVGYQKACELLFYVCYAATIIATILNILFVHRVGYMASYTDNVGGSGIPNIVAYLSRFTPVVFCLFLATKPPKRVAIIPLALYEFYAVLTLLTGQRYPFIGISMLILIYILLRSRYETGWIGKQHFLLLIILVPVLMVFLVAYDSIRLGESFSPDSFIGAIEDFFIQQGGSINVIRRTIYNSSQLQDMQLVSFQGIYSAIFENGIGRRLFEVTTYSGNSFERAMNSNNLAHRLSYIAYGNDYFWGRGTGSSFIAELLHDFSIIGIWVGSVIYGVVINAVNKIEFKHALSDGIKLAMVYSLLLSPRGGFDSFIAAVFNLYSIIGFILILIMAELLRCKGSGSSFSSKPTPYKKVGDL